MFIQCDHGIVKVFPNWTRGKTRNSGEITLERDFKPGEVVLLTMTGDCSATADGRNSLGAPLRKSRVCGRRYEKIKQNCFKQICLIYD